MMGMVNFVLPSHSSRVLSGDGLVGGNPDDEHSPAS